MDAPQPKTLTESAVLPIARIDPTAAGERLFAVDALRGFALFGILLVNMSMFSTPVYVAMMDTPWWTSPADHVAEFLVRLLAESKFYVLFSFLFGLGMALQMRRIESRGGAFVRIYVRRLLVLLGIGLCHALLLWFGDILTLYALIGFLLLLFRKRRNKAILIWAGIVYCLPLLLVVGSTAAVEIGRLFPESAATLQEEFANVERDTFAWAEYSVRVYSTGSFREIFFHRLQNHADILWGLVIMAPVVLTMFLLGLYVGRRGILHDPAAHKHLLWGLVLWGLPLGLIGNAAYTTLAAGTSRAMPTWMGASAYLGCWVGGPLLSFGYAAGLVLLVQRDAWRRHLAPLAAVGRMALTNYLLQTLICTTLFYSYGFGLFGKVGPAWGVVLSIAIYAVQVPLSVLWLRRFRFGPMEWLWRSLTYLRWQPMRVRPVLPPPTQGLITPQPGS